MLPPECGNFAVVSPLLWGISALRQFRDTIARSPPVAAVGTEDAAAAKSAR